MFEEKISFIDGNTRSEFASFSAALSDGVQRVLHRYINSRTDTPNLSLSSAPQSLGEPTGAPAHCAGIYRRVVTAATHWWAN